MISRQNPGPFTSPSIAFNLALAAAIARKSGRPTNRAPTPVVPNTPGSGQARPFVPRVPDITDQRRLSRATEKVHDILNALIRVGDLIQTGPAEWQIAGGSLGGLTGTFP